MIKRFWYDPFFDLLLIAEFPKLGLSMTTPMRIMKSNIEEVTRIMVSLPFFIILLKKFSHKELHVCYITPCKVFFILIKLFIDIVKFRLLIDLLDNQSMSSRFSHYFYCQWSRYHWIIYFVSSKKFWHAL